MLICASCGKIIANTDPSKIRYGGCASCPLDAVRKALEAMGKIKEQKGEKRETI